MRAMRTSLAREVLHQEERRHPRTRLESLPGGALHAGRELVVELTEALAPEEGVALEFASGSRLTMLRQSGTRFRLRAPADLLGRTFRLVRTPDGVAEAGCHGQVVPVRTLQVGDGRSWAFPVAWADRVPEQPPQSGTEIERRLEFTTLPSRLVPEPRRVRIHLPRAYSRDRSRLFPVVYALDGQNVLGPEEAFGGVSWSLDRVADQLEAEGGEPFVLVAVDHGFSRRVHEYTPRKDEALDEGGGAWEHLDFLLNEVIPQVREVARIEPGPGCLIGSSLAGLFGLWASIEQPAAFRRVAAVSPSVHWAGASVLATPLGAGPRPQVRVDMGTWEGPTAAWQLGAARATLRSRGWVEGQDLSCVRVPGGVHHEAAWADRAADLLRFLVHGPEF